jgi:hypothetical protein
MQEMRIFNPGFFMTPIDPLFSNDYHKFVLQDTPTHPLPGVQPPPKFTLEPSEKSKKDMKKQQKKQKKMSNKEERV